MTTNRDGSATRRQRRRLPSVGDHASEKSGIGLDVSVPDYPLPAIAAQPFGFGLVSHEALDRGTKRDCVRWGHVDASPAVDERVGLTPGPRANDSKLHRHRFED